MVFGGGVLLTAFYGNVVDQHLFDGMDCAIFGTSLLLFLCLGTLIEYLTDRPGRKQHGFDVLPPKASDKTARSDGEN
jgi:hypothetical protein